MIKFYCPQCKAKIGVNDQYAGRRVKCPKCAAAVSVPALTNEPPPPAGGVDIFANALQAESAAKSDPPSLDASPGPMPLPPMRPYTRTTGKPTTTSAAPQTFELHWWCGPVALLVVIIPIASRFTEPTVSHDAIAIQITQIIGVIIGTFIISMFLSWLLFRLSGRSKTVGSVIFCLVALMAVLGGTEAQRRRAANESVLQEVMAEVNKDKAALQQNSQDPDARLKYLKSLAGTVDKSSERLSGDEKIEAQGSAEMLRWMGAAAQPYNDALKRLQQAGAAKPSTLTSREVITERLQMVKELSDANDKFDADLKNIGPHYRAILDKTSLSDTAKDRAVKAFTSAPVYAYLPQIRETDRQITAAMTGMLNIMLVEWGEWHTNETGQVKFLSNKAATEYNEQFHKLQQAAQNQLALQKQAGAF